MLTVMRRHAKSWFITVFVAMIAIVFIFWGVGSYSTKDANRAALVNGQLISLMEFNDAYQKAIEANRNERSGNLTDADFKQIKAGTLDSLIYNTLILQAAEKAGVRISDETLQKAIMSQPLFQENGAFSPRRYQLYVRAQRLEEGSFEENLRKDLTQRVMAARLQMLTQISDEEVNRISHLLMDKIKISHVDFDPRSFREGINPTDSEISEFFQKNKDAYQVPEKVAVDYLFFNPGDFLAKAEITPTQVRELYDMTMDSYMEPAKAKIRDVLFKVPDEAKKEEIAEIKAQAEAFAAKVKEGGDFLVLAAEQEPATDWTKEPEWTHRDKMDVVTAQAVFATEPGQLAEPFQTETGSHVVRVEAREEPRQKEFDEVKAEIEKRLKEERSRELALEAAESAYGLSLGIKSMAELGTKIGLKSDSTELFSRNEPPKGSLADSSFVEAAFSLEEGQVGPAVELEDGYYLIMTTQKLPAHIPDLEKVKDLVTTDLISEKAKEAARTAAQELLKKAKDGNWLTLIREGEFELKEAPAFTRIMPVEGLGYNGALTESAFKLSFKNPLPDQVFEVGNKFTVIHFEDRILADSAEMKKKEGQYRQIITNRRQKELSEAWLTALREKADVDIDEQVL